MSSNNLKKNRNTSRIYGRVKRRRSKLYRASKMFLLFLIIAVISYFCCVIVYSFLNREHCTSVNVPDNYKAKTGKVTEKPKQEGKNQAVKKVAHEEIKAIEAPKSLIFKEDAFKRFLKSAKKAGKNAVIVILKDEAGNVLYNSEVEAATVWKTVAKNAVDARKIAKDIEEEGLKPIAKINAFLDQKAPAPSRENTFVYGGYTEKICKFKDKDPNNLQAFLNPSCKFARDYILNLVKEVKNLGFKRVLLENLRFPNCEFSSKMEGYDVKRDEVLKEFIKLLKNTGVDFMVGYDFNIFSGENSKKAKLCYGGDISKYGIKNQVVALYNPSEIDGFKEFALKINKSDGMLHIIPKLEFFKNLEHTFEDFEKNNLKSNIVLGR